MRLSMNISGLGIIFYSPATAPEIQPGMDYLSDRYVQPEDVAKHVVECTLPGFCTGSSGMFHLNITVGPPDQFAVDSSTWAIRLGAHVADGTLCFRDLYDLMEWEPDCPAEQVIEIPNGFYRVTIATSPPESGILGDSQEVFLYFEKTAEKPELRWNGVPTLC